MPWLERAPVPLTAVLSRLARSHRHVTKANASVFGLVLLSLAVLVAGSTQRRSTAAPPLATAPVDRAVGAPLASSPPASRPVALPTLPKLHNLIQAAVMVSSGRPLSDDTVARMVALAGANASLQVAVGDVQLGRGRTRALAADPVKTRVWTPAKTGRATPVWQRAVIGEAVVAHAVAKADGVPLGGGVLIRRGSTSVRLRVGAFATTQLPGIGLVVNAPVGGQLGLVPRTGLLLAVPGTDPAVTVAKIVQKFGRGVVVESVLSDVASRGGWVPPALGQVTSPFGMRVHPITGLAEFHNGIDIGAPLGAPVYAMTDGEVLYAGPASGFGSEIVLSHAGGVSTVYGHVSQLLISTGRVKAGQVIALVGSEGESTGPHLHAEVQVQDIPVDPVAWLQAHGVRFTR